MGRLLGIALIVPLALAPGRGDDDVLLLGDGSEVRGMLQDLEAGQTLVVKQGGRVTRLSIEEISRIQFAAPGTPPTAPPGARILLEHGGVLTGSVTGLADDHLQVGTVHGPVSISRSHLVSISWETKGPVPPVDKIEEGKDGVITGPPEAGKETKVEWGTVLRIDKEQVTLKAGDAEKIIAMAGVQGILFARRTSDDPPQAGWFARLNLSNGDRLVGVMSAVGPGEVTIFSHLLGRITVGRPWIQSIQFTPTARIFLGNLLVCDQGGVREFDSAGKPQWTYTNTKDMNFPFSALKMENGNILIASLNGNRVIEVRRRGASGGDVVWQSEPVQNPYDARPIGNGRILVAACGENAVFEIDVKTKKRGWSTPAVNQPTGAMRLANGNTLISTAQCVVEIDANQKEVWRAMPGLQPWRATRLDNGNTLIVEMSNNRVVEVTSTQQSRIVRKFEGVTSPVAAVRLDDGRTLVVERDTGRVMQFDLSGPPKVILERLNYPQNLSAY